MNKAKETRLMQVLLSCCQYISFRVDQELTIIIDNNRGR